MSNNEFASAGLTAGQLNAIVKKIGGHENALRLLRDELVVTEAVAEKLLERLTATDIPAIATFIASEKFRVEEIVDGIKVGGLGDNFRSNFQTKVEGAVVAEELAVNKLLKKSRDPAIITALGGEEMVEISLGQYWEYLKTADRNFWYVAYIRDDKDVLWAVYAYWLGFGLRVEASSLDGPHEWLAVALFLSR